MKRDRQKNFYNSSISKGEVIEDAYQKIKNMIYYNRLAPGQKLVYGDLARILNVSITPVIQALSRLEYSNLVYHEKNRGYSVKELNEIEAKELYQAREAFEIYIVSSVIQNLDSEKIISIRKAAKEHIASTSPEQRRFLMLKDLQFHLKIAEYAHNNVIYQHLKEIFEQIYLKYRPEYLIEERISECIKEHRLILQSLENGDTEKTIASIREHIRNGMSYIIKSLRLHKNIFF